MDDFEESIDALALAERMVLSYHKRLLRRKACEHAGLFFARGINGQGIMDLVTTFLIAVGLAMDAMAVSLGAGTASNGRAFRPFFRLSFHFGLFQAAMTFLGWLAGSSIAHWIEDFDHWVAFGLLLFVGARMIRSGFSNAQERKTGDLSRGGLLVMVSIATSIDALAVGLGLALMNVNILEACAVIGIVTSALSAVGLLVGGALGEKFGRRMEILGGLILIGIGIRILVTHLA